ncbi:hypothetical protein [Nioella nitratireducens]|nr:hypothetical protein [Nioella nitratireducens]
MTNTIAIWIVVLVLGVFAADFLYFGWDLPVLVGRQLLRLVDWVSFWH